MPLVLHTCSTRLLLLLLLLLPLFTFDFAPRACRPRILRKLNYPGEKREPNGRILAKLIRSICEVRSPLEQYLIRTQRSIIRRGISDNSQNRNRPPHFRIVDKTKTQKDHTKGNGKKISKHRQLGKKADDCRRGGDQWPSQLPRKGHF